MRFLSDLVLLVAGSSPVTYDCATNTVVSKICRISSFPRNRGRIFSKNSRRENRLRSELSQIYPGINKLVTELKGGDHWSGFGPGRQTGMFEWLQKSWKINT